ncbi:hypothetical protein TGDOM2_245440 [Toxoplasma gondii GAB2-2007-GAL-DOM2]|uniref:Uncharacterized protein n=2 Tax=Toxoplasma gondii TaxID=5811 RepID=A0A086JNW7_TOXGO|nr:hypothetical protein TGFOU_245440 [Toxoplasma gondii FOU]KFG47172.1 hypothetical protein TGDOM2_245440 [Toxoplasma gondii GAB2-2007-GAL-DOM2]
MPPAPKHGLDASFGARPVTTGAQPQFREEQGYPFSLSFNDDVPSLQKDESGQPREQTEDWPSLCGGQSEGCECSPRCLYSVTDCGEQRSGLPTEDTIVDWRPLDVFSDSEPLKKPGGSNGACTQELAAAEHGDKSGEEEGERGEDKSKRTLGGAEMGERCVRRGEQQGEKSENEDQDNGKVDRERGKQGANREREEEITAKYEREIQKGTSKTIKRIVTERERQTSEKEQKSKDCERGSKDGETGKEKDYEMLEDRTADGDKAEGKTESEGTGLESEDESEPYSKSFKKEEQKKGRKRDKRNREQGSERSKTDDEQRGSASGPEEEYGQGAEAKMKDRTKERRIEQEEDRDSNARKRQKQSRKDQHSGGVSGKEGKVKTPFLSAFSNCGLALVTDNYSSKENEKRQSGACGGNHLDPCLLTPTGREDERSEEIKKRTDIVAVRSAALSSAGERTEEKQPLTGEAEEEETQTNERDEATFITPACARGAAARKPPLASAASWGLA